MRQAVVACVIGVVATGMAVSPDTSARADAPGESTVEVTVRYDGPPRVESVTVNKDVERCGATASIEKVVVGVNKGLANAIVSVVGVKGPPAAVKAEIEQRGCRFVPHVVAMMPGQIHIKNADGILHNVHTYSTANAPINRAHPKFKAVIIEKLDKPEFVKLTCDIHSWMLAWIAVMPNPYFGVTDANGSTRIDHVPSGRYTLEVWHETLGKRSRDVELEAGRTVKVIVQMKK